MNKGYESYVQNGRRIVKGLGYYTTVPVGDCREIVKNSAKKYGTKPAFRFKRNGMIIEKNYLELEQDMDALGTALHSLGLKGSKISIISENRYEWAVAYLSIINGTGIGVPLDKYLPAGEVENLVQRSKGSAIFYSETYKDMMAELSKKDTTIKYFICFDESAVPSGDERFMSIKSLIEKGRELLAKGERSFLDAEINRKDMSILLFTSGTTKISKGVMLSHENITSNVTSITGLLKVYPTDVHLSLLPLHHTFENTVGLMFMLHMGVTISYAEGIRQLAQNIKEFKVTILIGVPAIFEALYSKVMEGIEKAGKTKLVNTMTRVTQFLLKLGIDIRRKVFKSVLEKLGPNLRIFVSGAAPIGTDILHGIERFGITFLQGYGLTETSPVVSCTSMDFNTTGTVGVPIKDVEVTIDNPDENGMGEIMVRGKSVMLGYYENPEETNEVMEPDGWFRTGDLGILDENGNLKITGRAKSMIVFTNGKKAFPEEFEILLNAIPGVKDSFVWGNRAPDGDMQVCAKLVVDKDYFTEKGYTVEQIGDELEAKIRQLNADIPKYKIIRYFVMTYEELVKTTTLKIKRPVETEKMKRYIENAGVDMRKLHKKFIINW
ncbi:MAG: AMP-binding protein [Clostridiaceae bacterium]|nr:AMP-binding protein [Clostridiaceae bacterium]